MSSFPFCYERGSADSAGSSPLVPLYSPSASQAVHRSPCLFIAT